MSSNSCAIVYEAKALLFDMDGTLVDSTSVVERTWHRFAERHSLDGNSILASAHGRPTAETVRFFAPKQVDHAKETEKLIAEEIADIEGIIAVPGAEKLLNSLPKDRWAIVTSASRELAIRRMNAAGLPIPAVFITAEDVQNGKPAPDGYLAAAKALDVSPEECIAFEDSPVGLSAAYAAGAQVFSVGSHLAPCFLENIQHILDFTHLELSNIDHPIFIRLILTPLQEVASSQKGMLKK